MRFRRHRLFVLATTATAVAATGAALGAFTPAESAVQTITVSRRSSGGTWACRQEVTRSTRSRAQPSVSMWHSFARSA